MNETIIQVLGYARGVWRYRWYMFLVAWPVCLVGWVMVSQMPNKYEANARVFVDTDSLLRPLLRGLAIEQDIQGQVVMMTKTLFSRPNLEKIARMTDMDLKAKNEVQMDEIVNKLKSHINLGGGRGDNLYSISFADADPKLAKQVVQSILTVLVENTLGDKRKDSDNAQQFVEQQIKDYEAKLQEGESRITEFKRKYVGLLPGEGQGYYERMQAAANELRNVQLLLKEAEQRRDEIKRQVEDEEPTTTDTAGHAAEPSIQNSVYDGRIQGLQARLDELLLRYTEKHPDVIATRSTLQELETKKNEDAAAAAKMRGKSSGKGEAGASVNPVYQQLKLAFGESEANVASLKVRAGEFKSRVDALEKLVHTVPQVEQEFVSLNRDYELNKQTYNTLISRRESAKLGEEAGQSGENVKFRVVDPPFVGNEPVSPNRPVLMSLVFVGAIAAGLALPLLLSLLRPTFDSLVAMRTVLGRPVLGSVSLIVTAKQKARRRIEIVSFGAVGAMLFLVYGGVMAAMLMGVHVPKIF